MPRSAPDFTREADALARGFGPVAGVDEVGRGPIAGPVVAAAVILDPAAIPPGLADSKLLGPEVRERLCAAIVATARVGLASVPAGVVDAINVRRASLLAMRRAVLSLPDAPRVTLVDGNDPPDLPGHVRTIVGGDALVASIAAASIVAKVVRDAMLVAAEADHPGYGFGEHKGYGTPAHLDALRRLGPCALHRRSFAPLKGPAARR